MMLAAICDGVSTVTMLLAANSMVLDDDVGRSPHTCCIIYFLLMFACSFVFELIYFGI